MNQAHSVPAKSPFATLPTGADVFIGPQAADLIQSVKSAFGKRDAIITVGGPAGVGKTTLVNHALGKLAAKKKVVRIDRESPAHKDLLEFLMVELGVKNRPAEIKRRFAIFRNALQQYESAGRSVIIVVEDTGKTGAAKLAELAALTAAGAGESSGARLVLMGKEDLLETLDDPQLESLRRRIAHRHLIRALTDVETGDYLAHCFRAAGGNFRQAFEQGAAELTHKLCDGNPRAISTLIDKVLLAAAAQDLVKISSDLIAETASECNFSSPGDRSANTAVDIAEVELLDDLDDAMAETVFGPEIDLFAIPKPSKG